MGEAFHAEGSEKFVTSSHISSREEPQPSAAIGQPSPFEYLVGNE